MKNRSLLHDIIERNGRVVITVAAIFASCITEVGKAFAAGGLVEDERDRKHKGRRELSDEYKNPTPEPRNRRK